MTAIYFQYKIKANSKVSSFKVFTEENYNLNQV